MAASTIRLEIKERLSPVFAGREFSAVGAYECISGTVHGALDPAHRLNADIVNLAKAPRNTAGMVEYASDFSIMKPLDPARGNGTLVYDVVNRGNKTILTRVNRGADGNRPTTAAHAGDGLLMRHGFSIVWSAWQTEVPPGNDRLNAVFPIATDNGAPIVRTSRDEFIAEGAGGPGDLFIQEVSEEMFIATLSYPAADMDPGKASLTVRQRERDARATPAGLRWRYVDARHIEVTRPGGAYDRGAIYEFIYPARDPAVMGIGFAAMRDLVAFLRHGTVDDAGNPNPLAAGTKHALGFGISQSGRVLRDFVHQGFNEDTSGRPVFDGMFAIVGGSRRTYINQEFAQPGRYSRQHEDHSFLDDQFPFTYPTLTDPISGQTDGILRRATERGVCPKLLHLDADSDLWAARSSLVVTDTNGNDIALPDNVRAYVTASVQHGVHRPPIKPATQLPSNPLSYAWSMRALLLALAEWVAKGTAPPPSCFPSRANGTLVTLEEAAARFPKLPGMAFPDVLNELHLRDHSVEPPREGPKYPVYVCATDADGNSVGGIRHPLVSVPLATHTGWSLRAPGYAEGDLFSVQGSILPFAETEAERARADDPRPSREARYATRDAWVEKLAAAADALVAQRHLLREDADRLVAAARESWDVFEVI
jgi:hypothetical protein